MLTVLLCVLISNQAGRATNGAIPTADDIARLLDSTADPCANFYRYVCGSSRRNTSKLDLSDLPGSLQARWLKVKDDISSMLQIRERAGSKVSEKAIIAYQSCMKGDSAHDIDSLKELLTDRGISDWPTKSSNAKEVYDTGNDIDLTELEAFFHYDVVQDKHDKSRHILSVGRASLPVLHGGVLASTDDLTEVPESLVRERAHSYTGGKQTETGNVHISSGSTGTNDSEDEATAQDLTRAETRIVQEYQSYVKAVITSTKSLASVESMELAKEIIHLEAKLARIAEAETGAQRKTAIYTTLRRLNEKYPVISLSVNLLKKHLRKKGTKIPDETKIYIAERAYIEDVFILLRKTSRYKVKNYVGWKIIATLAPFVSPLRPHHEKFMAQYGLHEKRKQDICTESIAATRSAMQPLISQLYVERKFSPEAKDDVLLMTELIQRELVASLRNSIWTSHEARRTALKAVAEMDKMIGYPDCMDDEEHLAELFGNR
ncbi:neprilysin-1-like [Dermacentor andersoni]|uniref:neprilysin-1-like n=1 Tax=Dermacentor andersoni TaxID=34620 RepID=UPI002415F4C4|nr:neprilysin-1-like [Dermacentor andersoni]